MTTIVALVAGLSWLAVGALRRYALSRGVIDAPKGRSSHVVPTPRGGGAGLVVAAVLGFMAGNSQSISHWPLLLGILAVVPVSVAGWLDDHRSLAVLPRLTAHAVSGVLLAPLASAGLQMPLAIVVGVAWVCIAISAINVVNFMDGIDGLIGLQAFVFGVHVASLAAPRSDAQLLGASLAAAAAGFLLWNWSPARIFLGDVGSGGIAIIGVVAGILVLQQRQWPFLFIFLPLYPIFLDATMTIIRRARRGESLAVAHRTHLYQRLTNERGWGHARVSILYGASAALATIVVLSGGSAYMAAAYLAGVTVAGALLDRFAR